MAEKETMVKTWREPVISNLILIVGIIAFFAVTFLPIRPIIAIVAFSKFEKDSTKHMRRYINNVECCRILIRNHHMRNKTYSMKELESKERLWFGKMWVIDKDYK